MARTKVRSFKRTIKRNTKRAGKIKGASLKRVKVKSFKRRK